MSQTDKITPEIIATAQRRAFLISDTIIPAAKDPANVAKMDHRLGHQFGSALAMAAADIKPLVRNLDNALTSLNAIMDHKDCPPEIKNFIEGLITLWGEHLDSKAMASLVESLEKKARETLHVAREALHNTAV